MRTNNALFYSARAMSFSLFHITVDGTLGNPFVAVTMAILCAIAFLHDLGRLWILDARSLCPRCGFSSLRLGWLSSSVPRLRWPRTTASRRVHTEPFLGGSRQG